MQLISAKNIIFNYSLYYCRVNEEEPMVIVTTSARERISIEPSDGGAKEIDEDEWTDRNFLPSETSGAGGLRYC